MNIKLTQKRLKKLLKYNPILGVWIWRVYRCRMAIKGAIAGTIHLKGYRLIKIDGISYRSSRLAFLYMLGYFPEHQVDHKDRVRDNDKWDNLREATPLCNNRNQNLRKDNSSGINGVSFYSKNKKWRSYISINKKIINLGYFKELKDAVKARWEAEKKYKWETCCTTSTAYLYLKSKQLCN